MTGVQTCALPMSDIQIKNEVNVDFATWIRLFFRIRCDTLIADAEELKYETIEFQI